jgi:F-type H+-transporting ATPase subunit delta
VATAAARRYAQAVFELASQEGRVEEWHRYLSVINDLMSDPAVAAVLENPTIPAARRMELIQAQRSLDPEAINLARLLIETRRTKQVGGILDEYESLEDEAAGRVRARVTSAVELSSEERELIGSKLSRRLGKQVTLSAAVDRTILGGLKVQYGDHLIDASLATRLNQLRRRLADAS